MKLRKVIKLTFTVFLIALSSLITAPFQVAADTVPDFLKEKKHDEPLQFIEISIKDVDTHSATIEWETNHVASGRVQIRSDHGNNTQRSRVSSLKRHSINLDDLIQGTTYHFRVFSWDNSGNRIKSQWVGFKTEGIPPPRLERKFVKEKTLSGGVIRWVTNIPTTALFESSHDTSFQFKTSHEEPTRYHQVRLDHFHPNKSINYRITIRDTKGMSLKTSVNTFRTRENNIAWMKPVEGTFDKPIYGVDEPHQGKTPFIQRVNDGNYDYQYGTANSGDPSDTDQWFSINLKDLHPPDTAVLFWRTLSYPKEYKILGSVQGDTWKVLAEGLNANNGKQTRKGGIPSYRHEIDLSNSEIMIKYIKVLIPKGASYYGKYPSYNFVQLQEFKLFPRSILKMSSRKMSRLYKSRSKGFLGENFGRSDFYKMRFPKYGLSETYKNIDPGVLTF